VDPPPTFFAVSVTKPLRVLSIAHPAVQRATGRRRYDCFAQHPDLDVHLLVPRRWKQFGRTLDADPAGDPGVTLHVLPIALPQAGPMGWYLHFYPALRRLIRQLQPDVIHLWEEPWSVVALQAALLKGEARLVMEVDQNILKRLPPPFEWIRRKVLHKTAHVLARSPDAAAVVRANGYRGPISPIGYGADLATFHPLPRDRSAIRSGLHLGYVGRLVVEKGLDDALDALARLPTDCTLAILGEGPYEPELRRRIDALGLRERVTIQGWAAPDAVAAFMRDLDILLLLTRTTGAVREQFGRVIIEAQACGTPVIGSACGAIPDVVGPGGWIVPESDPAALADLLRRLMENRAEIAACARAGAGNVAARFTYEAVVDALAAAWVGAASAGHSSKQAPM
jgi:glycosyltransferase involved in cell wall biosynthesis